MIAKSEFKLIGEVKGFRPLGAKSAVACVYFNIGSQSYM